MTKEELEKEAKEKWCEDVVSGASLLKIYVAGYLAGAEPREKRIVELEAQIEKMKNCGNCTHKYCSKCKKKKVLSDVDYWELAD